MHESLLTNLYKQGPVKLKDTIWFKNIPHLQFLFLKATYSPPSRASDRVRQKMGNFAAFSREIMWQERSIMQQIMRFFKADLTLFF